MVSRFKDKKLHCANNRFNVQSIAKHANFATFEIVASCSRGSNSGIWSVHSHTLALVENDIVNCIGIDESGNTKNREISPHHTAKFAVNKLHVSKVLRDLPVYGKITRLARLPIHVYFE